MASRTYMLFMEAKRAALAASGRLEGAQGDELLPDGVTAWNWAHSRAFAGAALHEAGNDEGSTMGTRYGPVRRT